MRPRSGRISMPMQGPALQRFILTRECLQGKKKEGMLALTRQLIGNNDEVTDLRLIGPSDAPTHLALATNSPAIRIFDIQTLNCTATLAGHADIVLVLDALRTKGATSCPMSEIPGF